MDNYESALKVRSHPIAATLCLRRTLEMICKEKGGTKGKLVDKLKRLSEKGVIPPLLDEMANILRDIGNEAAHGDDFKASPISVHILFDFTRTILEYVFVLPSKLSQIQEQLGKKMELNGIDGEDPR